MRKTNKQFTEEVFRRSEEKIQKQKQKKRAYMTIGKSLAACLVFFIVLGVMPYIWYDSSKNGHPSKTENITISSTENEEIQESEESLGVDIEKVEKLSLTSTDLMTGIDVEGLLLETQNEDMQEYLNNYQMDMYVKLFQQSVTETPNKNTLISPISISAALSMTANGARGITEEEMQKLLSGKYTIEEYSQWFGSYLENLPSEEGYKLAIANAIWFKDDESFHVNKDFLQSNANYFGASLYKSSFDQTTVKDMNQWVNYHTEGHINKIIDQIDERNIMYLINALSFDGVWEETYSEKRVKKETFTDITGREQNAVMMYSTENIYLEDENTIGFMKAYQDEKYYFVALLPEETISLENYISSLTGEKLQNILENQKTELVNAGLPKFSYDYEVHMNQVLTNLGLNTAFHPYKADFSGLGSYGTANIYISDVLHKTFIDVNENGTKASATTSVGIELNSSMKIHEVKLNRPFVYMIIDANTNLPIFMGTVTNPEG